MILWTIQSKIAFHTLEQTGCLRTDSSFSFCKEYFVMEQAYQWMAAQMRQRVSPPPNGVEFPLWAWYQWEGVRKRPDMRRSGYAESGEAIVLLTLDIPDQQVLLSDFDLFHYPLNGWYAAKTEQEDQWFEARYSSVGYSHHDLTDIRIQTDKMLLLRNEIQQSWEVVFDLTSPGDDCFFSKDRSIQATFWELRLAQVIKVEHFRAR